MQRGGPYRKVDLRVEQFTYWFAAETINGIHDLEEREGGKEREGKRGRERGDEMKGWGK